jgi:nitrogen fixation NifU-like protein
MYSEKYLAHFTNPQNLGEVLEPDGLGEVAHEGGGCLDRVKMTMKVSDGKIAELKYKLRACSGTIAACSAVTALALGREVAEAEKIGMGELLEELGGVPEKKVHSVELAERALKATILDYRRRSGVLK